MWALLPSYFLVSAHISQPSYSTLSLSVSIIKTRNNTGLLLFVSKANTKKNLQDEDNYVFTEMGQTNDHGTIASQR